MTILQAGMPKSGNYWLYQILHSVVEECQGIEMKSYIRSRPIYEEAKKWHLSTPDQVEQNVIDFEEGGCFYRISSRFREEVADLDQYLDNNTLSWTHSKAFEGVEKYLSRFGKLVYIIRDPRDIAISMSYFILTPYMKKHYPSPYNTSEAFLDGEIEKQVRLWQEHVLGYLPILKPLGGLVLFYENMIEDFDRELRALITYLGLNLSEEKIESVKGRTSFSGMKKTSPQHVRKGKCYNWQSELTGAQAERAREAGGETLALLGYPLTLGDDARPAVPRS